jgi:sulfatase maturation enzyme AslB (radical SAM superfamily)
MEYSEQFQIGRIREIQGNSIMLSLDKFYKRSTTLNIKQPDRFAVGDIVIYKSNGAIHTIWRPQNKDNIIYATNKGNMNCKFCPQPRGNDDILNTLANDILVRNLSRKDIDSVTITGGEPTLLVASTFFRTFIREPSSSSRLSLDYLVADLSFE